MSTVTEILLVTALMVSDTPVTDVVPVVHEMGNATSTMVAAPASTLLTTGLVTDVVTPESMAVATSTGASVSTVLIDVDGMGTLLSTAEATSAALVYPVHTVISTAAMTSVALPINELTLSNTGNAVSTTLASTASTSLLTSTVLATSTVTPGQQELASNTAAATSTITGVVSALETLTSTGAATSSLPVASGDVDPNLLTSTGSGTSTLLSRLDAQDVLLSTGDGTSTARFKNPAAVAWVLNTETTGTSTYENFDFESVTQTPDKVLAVGPDGLYELTGGTDAGEEIDARIVSGFTDFKLDQIKRVDAMYFGYTSVGGLALKVETLDSGHAPTTYLMEARQATAPRSTRVVVGKGMSGRYWRVTLSNVAGADFEIHDATVDIAVSTRRV